MDIIFAFYLFRVYLNNVFLPNETYSVFFALRNNTHVNKDGYISQTTTNRTKLE